MRTHATIGPSTSQDVQAIKVLLVEDEEVDAMLITRLLSNPHCGEFAVQRASSLAEAIEELQVSDYDIALLDLGLPDGSRIDSLHQLRAVDARLPIVVLTGHDDEELGLEAIESGAQDFLCKDSISGRSLFRVLRYAIARQLKMLGIAAQANTDPLTNLPNRRHLDSRFRELQETRGHISVAFLDIDHFKNVNDTLGHGFGDFVLSRFAALLVEQVGESDLVARLGGEEFVIVFCGSDRSNALDRTESILRVIEQSAFRNQNDEAQVTASAGVVQVTHDERWESVASRADRALYQAKESGRNRAVAGELPPTNLLTAH